jgi:hypothetical protein
MPQAIVDTSVPAAGRVLVRVTVPSGRFVTFDLTADRARELCNQIGAAIAAASPPQEVMT